MRRVLILLSMVLLSAAFTCEKQLTGPEAITPGEVEKQVRRVWDEKWAILHSMDLAAWDQLYSVDGFLAYVSGGHYSITSRKAFMDSMTVWWGGRSAQSGTLLQLRIHALAADLALLDCTLKWQINSAGGPSVHVLVTNSSLYRKEEGGWKIIYEQESFGPVD